jgi:hypothetical protein
MVVLNSSMDIKSSSMVVLITSMVFFISSMLILYCFSFKGNIALDNNCYCPLLL